MRDIVRLSISLPRDLIAVVDAIAGPHQRSTNIAEALTERARRDRQLAALRNATDALDPASYPHWATSQQTSDWVRALRREADAHSMAKLRRRQKL